MHFIALQQFARSALARIQIVEQLVHLRDTLAHVVVKCGIFQQLARGSVAFLQPLQQTVGTIERCFNLFVNCVVIEQLAHGALAIRNRLNHLLHFRHGPDDALIKFIVNQQFADAAFARFHQANDPIEPGDDVLQGFHRRIGGVHQVLEFARVAALEFATGADHRFALAFLDIEILGSK